MERPEKDDLTWLLTQPSREIPEITEMQSILSDIEKYIIRNSRVAIPMLISISEMATKLSKDLESQQENRPPSHL